MGLVLGLVGTASPPVHTSGFPTLHRFPCVFCGHLDEPEVGEEVGVWPNFVIITYSALAPF